MDSEGGVREDLNVTEEILDEIKKGYDVPGYVSMVSIVIMQFLY